MIKEIKLNNINLNITIKEYLKEFHNISSRSLKISTVSIDGKKVRKNSILPKNGVLILETFEKESNIIPKKMDLDVVYEDENLIIVNKPPFLLTHPSLKKVDITLANVIKYHYPNIMPRFINRLDMNTSGLIMIAKNSFTQHFIQSNKNISKKYYAICEGKLEDQIVEENILKVDDRLDRIIDPKGQYAKTEFKLIKYYPSLDISLVDCTLYTGRTHQIRVHLKHINYPLLGDELYNPNSNYNKIVNRQFLHSYYLKFLDQNNKEIEVKIPNYKDMSEFLKDLI